MMHYCLENKNIERVDQEIVLLLMMHSNTSLFAFATAGEKRVRRPLASTVQITQHYYLSPQK